MKYTIKKGDLVTAIKACTVFLEVPNTIINLPRIELDAETEINLMYLHTKTLTTSEGVVMGLVHYFLLKNKIYWL